MCRDHISYTVFPSVRDIALHTAHLLEGLGAEAIAKRGVFTLVLAGGRTPDTLFALLAEPEWRERIKWSVTYVFWGDERCVPPDDEASNYKRAYELLLSHVVPAEVCRIKGELPQQRAACDYEKLLMRHSCLFKREEGGSTCRFPRFDCILLGMGMDGHIASIFPGESAEHEMLRTSVAQYITALASWRVTLTLPVINNARNCIFLTAGEDKKNMLQKMACKTEDLLPAQRVKPVAGDLHWFHT